MKLAGKSWWIFLMLISLAACGFHLRGPGDIPFKSIYISGNTLVISKNLKKTLAINDVQLSTSPDNADLQLELVGEENEKRILSIGAQGTVNEYEIFYRVHYRSKLADKPLWNQVQTIEARRDFTYSDANLLGKQTDEKLLNLSMQDEVINALVRRISALK